MRTQVSIHLRFNFFVEFFGFFTIMNFLSSSNSSVKWSKHNVPFFKSSIVQKGMYIVKGGNVLEYRTKANAFSKPKSNHPLTTLVLQLYKCLNTNSKRRKPCPWKFATKFKRNLLLHVRNASQNMEAKQSNKFWNERIFEHLVSSKPITWKKLQHSSIWSHLFKKNLQHCNVSLSFDKIPLTIVLVLFLVFNWKVARISSCETCFDVLNFLSILEIPEVLDFSNKNIMFQLSFRIGFHVWTFH